MYLNQAFADKNGIYGSMRRLGSSRSGGVGPNMIDCEAVRLPRLGIGELELTELPITLEVASAGEHHFASHLGIEVLRRFDTIIDFQNNTIFLKPNSSIGEAYRLRYSTGGTAVVIGTSAAVVVLLAAVVAIRRKRRRLA